MGKKVGEGGTEEEERQTVRAEVSEVLFAIHRGALQSLKFHFFCVAYYVLLHSAFPSVHICSSVHHTNRAFYASHSEMIASGWIQSPARTTTQARGHKKCFPRNGKNIFRFAVLAFIS